MKELHCHTVFCDGKNTPEEMVLSAIEKGLDTIGISGHSYTSFDSTYCMTLEGTKEYIRRINDLKAKYADKITVLCGMEKDYYSDYPNDEFDYVIGSVHYVKVGDRYVDVDESPEKTRFIISEGFNGDPLSYCEAFFESAGDVAKKTDCDIIGHFDLLTKFNEIDPIIDTSHERYISAWKKAADSLLKSGKIFEINTGAISRGYRTSPYPAGDIIDYLKSRGAKFILSGDAHRKEDLCFAFDKYEYLLK